MATFDEELRILLMEEGAPLEVARTLLALSDDALRMEAARRITRERLCVRDSALLVRAMAKTAGIDQRGGNRETRSNPEHTLDKGRENGREKSPNRTGRIIGAIRDQRLYINALRDIARQMRAAGISTTIMEEERPGSLEMTISISTRRRRAARYQSM